MHVAHFGALEEARAAHHRIGDLQHDEALFEGAHLEGGADQHGGVAIPPSVPAPVFDVVGDQAGFGLSVPHAAHAHLLAAVGLGPQGLAEPRAVLGDEAGGGGEDVLGRAVVALQPHDLGARKIPLEAQDVVDLRPSPAIDRLVVVADAADVLARLAKEPQPQILGRVGVLILVDQDVAKPVVIVGQHVRMLREQGQVVQEKIAEVAGVQGPQAVLIEGVDVLAAPAREHLAIGGADLFGGEALVLPLVDQSGHQLGRPALGVDVLRLDELFEQALLVVVVEDGEARLQPHKFCMAPQDLGRDRVKGAEPAQPFGRGADLRCDPLPHLLGGLVGEGDGEDLPRFRPTGGQKMRKPCGQHPRLACPCARQHQNWPFRRLHGLPLLRIEAGGEVRTRRAGEVRDARRRRREVERRVAEGVV